MLMHTHRQWLGEIQTATVIPLTALDTSINCGNDYLLSCIICRQKYTPGTTYLSLLEKLITIFDDLDNDNIKLSRSDSIQYGIHRKTCPISNVRSLTSPLTIGYTNTYDTIRHESLMWTESWVWSVESRHQEIHNLSPTQTWWARAMRLKPCFLRNWRTTSPPNVNDTPRSFSPHPVISCQSPVDWLSKIRLSCLLKAWFWRIKHANLFNFNQFFVREQMTATQNHFCLQNTNKMTSLC